MSLNTGLGLRNLSLKGLKHVQDPLLGQAIHQTAEVCTACTPLRSGSLPMAMCKEPLQRGTQHEIDLRTRMESLVDDDFPDRSWQFSRTFM